MNPFEDAIERIKKSTGARTQVELASILGIRQSSISDAKRRKSVPADWLVKLFRAYGLNPDWILEGAQPQFLCEGRLPAMSVSEPSVGYAPAAARSRTVAVSTMAGARDEEGNWLPLPVEQLVIPETFARNNLLVVKVDSTGMEPLIRKGAYVGIDRDQTRVMSGELYAVAMPLEGLVLRRVYHDSEHDRILLRSENPAYSELSLPIAKLEATVVGRLVWMLQEL